MKELAAALLMALAQGVPALPLNADFSRLLSKEEMASRPPSDTAGVLFADFAKRYVEVRTLPRQVEYYSKPQDNGVGDVCAADRMLWERAYAPYPTVVTLQRVYRLKVNGGCAIPAGATWFDAPSPYVADGVLRLLRQAIDEAKGGGKTSFTYDCIAFRGCETKNQLLAELDLGTVSAVYGSPPCNSFHPTNPCYQASVHAGGRDYTWILEVTPSEAWDTQIKGKLVRLAVV